jgi:hypothetical protein
MHQINYPNICVTNISGIRLRTALYFRHEKHTSDRSFHHSGLHHPNVAAALTPANALLALEKELNSLVMVDPVNLQIVARDGIVACISNCGATRFRASIPARCGSRMDWNS